MKILVSIPEGIMRDSFFPIDVQEKLEQIGTIIWNKTTEQFGVKEFSEKIRDVDVTRKSNTGLHRQYWIWSEYGTI
jgi:hypothetical protein